MSRKKNGNGPPTPKNKHWGFLTNHAQIALLIAADPKILQRTLADKSGLTERAVLRILLELEEGGFLSRRRVGRSNVYELKVDTALQDPHNGHVKLGDLIRFFQQDS